MANESWITGKKYKILTDLANKKWSIISFINKATDTIFNDGKSAETKLGVINGITSDINCEDETIAASAAMVNELVRNSFQTVSDGKALLASAITNKGVSTDAGASFATMAENIKKISTSPKSLNGQDKYWQAQEVVSRTVTFTSAFSSAPKVNASGFIIDSGGTSKNLDITITSISKSGFNYKTAMPPNYGDVTVTWNAVV